MELKTVSPAVKKDGIMKEIAELEANIAAAKGELYIIENEEKLESHKKNFLEVKRNGLKESIEFYKNKAKENRRLLSIKLVKYAKYSMAATCYDKLLEAYTENYSRNIPAAASNQVNSDISVNNWDCRKQTEDFQKEIDELQSKIRDNVLKTNLLLESLEYSPN